MRLRVAVVAMVLVALCPLAVAAAVGERGSPAASTPGGAPRALTYDFEDGTQGWQFDSAIWLRVPVGAGFAMRGVGDGPASSPEVTSGIYAVRLRLRLETTGSEVRIVLNNPSNPAATNHGVQVAESMLGVGKADAAGDVSLGEVPYAVTRGVEHELTLYLGGGSLDVYLGGQAVIGADVDASATAIGLQVSVLGDSVVTIDDVEISTGTEPSPHTQAPRPPASRSAGPDVGPFVGAASPARWR